MATEESTSVSLPKEGERKVQFASLGDWGDATGILRNIANELSSRLDSIEFIVALGDNFYFSGVESVDDNLWETVFLKPFANVARPFYAILGNHDWDGNVEAQLAFHERDARWNMEHYYYTKIFKDGLLQIFFLDTTSLCPIASKSLTGKIFPNKPREAQYEWLERELEKSTARWKFVVGHYPVHSNGENGSTVELRRLERLMQGFGVDAYICGHDHSMQHHFHRAANLHHFISGSGSSTRYFRQYGVSTHTLWQSLTGGYLWCDVSESEALFEFISFKGLSLYKYTISKPTTVFEFIAPQNSATGMRVVLEPHSPAAIAAAENAAGKVCSIAATSVSSDDEGFSSAAVALLLEPGAMVTRALDDEATSPTELAISSEIESLAPSDPVALNIVSNR